MAPRRSTRAVAVVVALWVLACAAALALATTDDVALAQGCRGGGSPSPTGSSPSPSESGGGGPVPSLPVSLPPGPDGGRNESVPEPAPRPAPRLDPHEKVPVVTAQDVTCRSTVTIAYDEGRRDKFKGKVGSAEPMCKRARDVTVKKVERGRDLSVGKAVTNAKGKYRVPARNGNGRFYAKVSKATVENDDGETVRCRGARSKTIRP